MTKVWKFPSNVGEFWFTLRRHQLHLILPVLLHIFASLSSIPSSTDSFYTQDTDWDSSTSSIPAFYSSFSLVLCSPFWYIPMRETLESNKKRAVIFSVFSWVTLPSDSYIFPRSPRIKFPPDQVKSTHHTLPGHGCGRTNGWSRNLRRGAHPYFILANLLWVRMLGW